MKFSIKLPYISLQQSDRDTTTAFGNGPGEEALKFLALYTTTGHEPLTWKINRHINFADMFSDVPEIEANTFNGVYYEPCLNC